MRIPANDFAEDLNNCYRKIFMLKLMGFEALYDSNTNSVHVYWLGRDFNARSWRRVVSENNVSNKT